MIWIGTGAVMAIMLGILVLFSDGPLPSIQVDEGHILPFGVDRLAGWSASLFCLGIVVREGCRRRDFDNC
jgi:hypothetical protein